MAGIHPSGGEDRYTHADLAQGIDFAVELGLSNIGQRALASKLAITEEIADLSVAASSQQMDLKHQIDEIRRRLQQTSLSAREGDPGSESPSYIRAR